MTIYMPTFMQKPTAPPKTAPVVIGHRGACGYVPEHTLTSYFIAMQDGVDYVEPDLVMTKDGVLVARHENEIGGTTDVAQRPEFAERRAKKTIDGVVHDGWFTEDFTLAELKTLRARERIPEIRPGNTRFDGQFQVPTFEEILALVDGVHKQREMNAKQLGNPAPKRIGVYPETKHPTYFQGIGLPMEELLVKTLDHHGYKGRDGLAIIQCFEVANLKAMRRMTELPIVQLMEAEGGPYDFVAKGVKRTYREMTTPSGLAEVATYATAIGPHKLMLIPLKADGTLDDPLPLIHAAHAAGLGVHAYTFRAENQFLPKDLRSDADPHHLGDLQSELKVYLNAGLDGFFTDHADYGAKARDAFV
ncbi:MAG: glycerophosphoryl diester phosphodiesterase [Gammaproteobacteria bacterium]|jgi:glycerophosphoryl diester phosphodiesterase|nr:glycerophosphoryl diester phosphodiesterase [Gammaproteobacteria bacterium]